MRRTRQHLFALGTLLLASLEATQACQICVPFPKESAADHLLAARTVVLAREKSFAYEPIETLAGSIPEAKIDLLVDSSTRRMLAANPDRSVLLVESPEGDWRRIGVAGAEVKSIAERVLASRSRWKTDPRSRVVYFAGLLDHDSSQIRTLAHLEVGRAPYDEIRRLGKVLSREEIRSYLSNLRYVEWHPLYILLLAQDPEPQDRSKIIKSFRSAARFGTTTRLAAWTTAYIEIEGQQAIADIEQTFFKSRQRSAEELQEVTRALSVHGSNGHTHLRDRIVAAYEILIANHPSLTPSVASDLIAWKRTELRDAVGSYASAKPRDLDFATTLRLRAYARPHQSQP